MRVLFDHNIFSRQPYGGVTRYFGEIIPRLRKVAEVRVAAPIHTSRFLQQTNSPYGGGIRLPQLKGVGRLANLVNEALHPVVLSTWKPNILHETHYSGRTLNGARTNVVFTVHDLTPELFPEHFGHYGPILAKRSQAFNSDADFVAISENTKRDLTAHFDVDPERVQVIHHGASALPETRVTRRKDQVLYVGGRGGYKNFDGLLSAFRHNSRLARDIELVVFGGGSPMGSELAAIAAAGLQRVRFIGGDDAALANAYGEAALFVYPSQYEGFGLPLLEAMTSCCPIACSKRSCFPEIAGPAAAYFDPNDPAGMAETIERLLDDGQARQSLANAGVARVQSFSWDRSANEHLAFYEKIIGRA